MHQKKQRQSLILILAAVMTGVTLLAGVGIYLALRAVDSSTITPRQNSVASQEAETSIPPVETSPLQPETPVTVAPQTTTSDKSEPGKNLGGVNWKGRDLRTMNLRNAKLGGANLEAANLSGVDLTAANLSGAKLGKTNLKNANLTNADLRGANLGNANLSGAKLNGTLLDGANLNGATMP